MKPPPFHDDSSERWPLRSQEEDDFDDAPQRQRKRLSPEQLRSLARIQDQLRYRLMGYTLASVLAILVFGGRGSGLSPAFVLVVSLISGSFVHSLILEIDGPRWAFLWLLLALVPGLGLLVMIVCYYRAKIILKYHGVRVGFWG